MVYTKLYTIGSFDIISANYLKQIHIFISISVIQNTYKMKRNKKAKSEI